MSSTRRAIDQRELAQEKYLSNGTYVEARGLLGNIVAAKTQLYKPAKYRRLLFSLQALSMEFGGLRQIARDLIRMFPDRLCTSTMQRNRAAKNYSADESDTIGAELNDLNKSIVQENFAAYLASGEVRNDQPSLPPSAYGTPTCFAEQCAIAAVRHFDSFLVDLCIKPEIDVEEIASTEWAVDAPYFRNPIGALIDYLAQRRVEHAHGRVITSLGGEVRSLLDHALATRRMVIIEGKSGSGKTHETESWCFEHIGEARFVTLSGITNRTVFFPKLAASLGLSACQQASAKLQARIEAHLVRSKLMLVIDEAHFLWPQHRRNHSAPELIDWINTMVNHGVPIALICTDQFAKLKAHVEKQVGWNSDQLMHRASRYRKLPDTPTKQDVLSVAANLLSFRWSEAHEAWTFDPSLKPEDLDVKAVAFYGLTNLLPLGAVRSIIDDARRIAREEHGRDTVRLADIKLARDAQERSDLSIRAAFETPQARDRRRRVSLPSEQISEEQMSDFSSNGAGHPRLSATSLVVR